MINELNGFSHLPYFPACPSGCAECVSVGECRICTENLFTKNGQCTPDCGHGFYADMKMRTCQGNTLLSFNHLAKE